LSEEFRQRETLERVSADTVLGRFALDLARIPIQISSSGERHEIIIAQDFQFSHPGLCDDVSIEENVQAPGAATGRSDRRASGSQDLCGAF
jgi:hypothetical protein